MRLFSKKKKAFSWQAEKELVVPLEHLPENVQSMIKAPNETHPILDIKNLAYLKRDLSILDNQPLRHDKLLSLRELRTIRGAMELISGGASILTLLNLRAVLPDAVNMTSLNSRSLIAWAIQGRCTEILSKIQSTGVVSDKFIDEYPLGFAKPEVLMKSHPIFYIDKKGNFHFLKETRMECARYAFQKRFLGKGLGLNPWRWRVYLRPPEAPEPVRKWATNKATQWYHSLRPAMIPVRVQSTSNMAPAKVANVKKHLKRLRK